MRVTGRLPNALQLLTCLGLALSVSAAVPRAYADSGCTQLILDGGFETGKFWQLGRSSLPPQYVSNINHSGNYALALGITDGGNVHSYSSARQTVTIPAGATQVMLSFWAYPIAQGAVTTDYMELVLLSADGNDILDKPWYSHNDSQSWNQLTFDLTPWRGWTLQVYFNVFNDGLGGTAGMFLDDVSLVACPGGSPVPPPMPTLCPQLTSTPCWLPTATSCPLPTSTPCPLPTATSCPSPKATSCLPPSSVPTRPSCALLFPCQTPVGPSATALPCVAGLACEPLLLGPTWSPTVAVATCPPTPGASCPSWSPTADPPASASAVSTAGTTPALSSAATEISTVSVSSSGVPTITDSRGMASSTGGSGPPAITPAVTTLALAVTSRPPPTLTPARRSPPTMQATRVALWQSAGSITERWPVEWWIVALAVGGGLAMLVLLFRLVLRS